MNSSSIRFTRWCTLYASSFAIIHFVRLLIEMHTYIVRTPRTLYTMQIQTSIQTPPSIVHRLHYAFAFYFLCKTHLSLSPHSTKQNEAKAKKKELAARAMRWKPEAKILCAAKYTFANTCKRISFSIIPIATRTHSGKGASVRVCAMQWERDQ